MPHVGFIALSVIFAALALVVLIRRIAFPCTLELSDDAILLPHGHPWPRITTIPYADIISIQDGGDSLLINTARGSFTFGTVWFEGYPAVRETISSKTAIALKPLRGKPIGTKFFSDEFPEPVVQWVEPEDWPRLRRRAAISKPVLYQLRTELWFFVRCYAFCYAFIVLPFLGFVVLPWLSLLGPFQPVAVFISSFPAVLVLAIFFTMLDWLQGIDPVRRESEISFRERGITMRLFSGQRLRWDYRQFCGWTVIERPFKGNTLEILLLKRLVKGRACNEAFALPDASVRDQMLQIQYTAIGRLRKYQTSSRPGRWNSRCPSQ